MVEITCEVCGRKTCNKTLPHRLIMKDVEEIKNKYIRMAEYASLRLGTTLDSMCCTVEEVGKLFKEIKELKIENTQLKWQVEHLSEDHAKQWNRAEELKQEKTK